MTEKKMPDFRAYVVIERQDARNIWTDVGVGFLHGDGAGLNIMLDALPTGGKLVLRPFVNEGRHEPTAPTN